MDEYTRGINIVFQYRIRLAKRRVCARREHDILAENVELFTVIITLATVALLLVVATIITRRRRHSEGFRTGTGEALECSRMDKSVMLSLDGDRMSRHRRGQMDHVLLYDHS